jgi:hypothetical protein
MSLPAGITTATVTVGVPVTFTGAAVKTFVSIEPSAFLVHAATGTPLVDFLEEMNISEGVAGQYTLPHTDQAGFIDESGNAYTNWYYTARVTYSTPSKAKNKAPKVKVFQLTTGQTDVDLDLLPGGAPALPYIAPTATVTAFGGRTGPVVLEESDLPARLADAALNATIASETAAPLAGKADKSVTARQMDARDSFAGKADGPLSAAPTADTGHGYTLYSNDPANPYKIVSGYLTHTQGVTTATTAAYAGIELPSRVGRIWADFRYPTSGISASENLVLIVSDALFANPTFANAAAHFNITRTGWSYEILQKTPFTITVVASGTFATPLAFDTDYQVAVEYAGTTATIYLPDGTVKTATHANIDTWRGKHATIENYAFDGSARSLLYIKGWGADVEKTDLSRAATTARARKEIVPAAMVYKPSTELVVAIPSSTTDVDATNLALTFTAPASGKAMIEVEAWVEITTSGHYLWGLSHTGTGGFGGGLQRVHIGTTNERKRVRWLLDTLTPYQVVTVKLQHLGASGAVGSFKAGSTNGYYATITATPVQ